jgi:hypothetical protein
LIFLSFLATMLVLGGAEWAAQGHRLDVEAPAPETARSDEPMDDVPVDDTPVVNKQGG